jgi:hypothetical protein
MLVPMPPRQGSRDSARNPRETVTPERGQSRPPVGLAQWIELVNAEQSRQRALPLPIMALWFRDRYRRLRLYPEDPEEKQDLHPSTLAFLISAIETPERLRARMEKMEFWHTEAGLQEMCRRCTAELSPETLAFLGPVENLGVFMERFDEMRHALEVLWAVASRREGWEDALRFEVRLLMNEQGKAVQQKNPVLDALKGVHLDHIRSCAVCERIFWAPRINSACCSEQCRNTHNQRKSRARRRKERKVK